MVTKSVKKDDSPAQPVPGGALQPRARAGSRRAVRGGDRRSDNRRSAGGRVRKDRARGADTGGPPEISSVTPGHRKSQVESRKSKVASRKSPSRNSSSRSPQVDGVMSSLPTAWPSVLPVLFLEVADQARQHFCNLLVQQIELLTLVLEDIASIAGNQ